MRNNTGIYILSSLLFAFSLAGCKTNNGNTQAVDSLPVVPVVVRDVKVYIEYNASIQGENDIEIRPQVDGIITRLYVEEGSYVRKGDKIIQIDERPFTQELNQTNANLSKALAALEKEKIENDRIERLSQNSVVSEIQFKTARAEYNEALSNVKQAEAVVSAASINLGYTTITAPTDGYIGRYQYKTGSLVSRNSLHPLTKLSSTNTVYVYFSMSERDYMKFNESQLGNSLEEKLKNIPSVQLILSSGETYSHEGKMDIVAGQFNRTTGLITFRASFPNDNNTLLSGTMGKVRIASVRNNAVVIPQAATFELQNKVFSFVVVDDNRIERRLVTIEQAVPNYYILSSGLSENEKIILEGINRMVDGTIVNPVVQPFDSLLVKQPLPI
jgi:membrane fusion protein (multidrug efflux system)